MTGTPTINTQPGWQPPATGEAPGDRNAYRKDRYSYVAGLVLALILTAVPFALVHWHAMTTSSLLLVIGLFALAQAIVHFRCFLHVDLSRGSVDHLLLVLFSAVILIMMAGGTVWILGNLHSRMY